MNEVLSVAEVAELLGCSESTVEELARKRELPGVQFGRPWVFPREALLKVLNEKALEKPTPTIAAPGKKRNMPPVLSF